MKQLFFIILFISYYSISAQVFDKETIRNFENDDKRINLVILSDGYQANELAQFKTDAINFTNSLFSQSPFKEYSNYFNVHIIKVSSNESGADHPGTSINPTETPTSPITPVKNVDTYFNSTFDSYGSHRLLYYEIDGNAANNTKAKIYNVLANNYPTYDQGLILVNSNVYGGSGGEFPMASKGVENGISATEVAIHELGHSFANLKDEYFPLGEIYFSEAINMTQESNPSFIKWKNWLNGNGIGIYQYNTTGYAANWYRPHQACKMRYLGYPFCSVCKEGIIEKIHSLVSPIDSYTPVSNTITTPTFPIDFHLELIKPDPNTLKSKWVLNNVDFANDVDDVSVLETNLNTALNTLAVTIIDDTVINNDASTALIKVDNHNTFHVYTVTWTIDNSALGIKNITSEVAKYNITMYPNPANSVVNFKLETDTEARLKVEISSLDGKKLKTIRVYNNQTNQIDISNLSTGIYLTNFYSGNMLIASKKLVKN